MEDPTLGEIYEFVDKYETKRKKLRVWGIITGTISLLLTAYFIYKYAEHSINVKVGGLVGFVGLISGSFFRMGTKSSNKQMESIRIILEHRKINDNNFT